MTLNCYGAIFINNDTGIFLLNSYVRGNQAYMDVWNAIINDSEHCKNEEHNEFDTMNSIRRLLPLFVMTA